MFQTFRIRHRPESHLELRVGVHTGAGDNDDIGGGLMFILFLPWPSQNTIYFYKYYNMLQKQEQDDCQDLAALELSE